MKELTKPIKPSPLEKLIGEESMPTIIGVMASNKKRLDKFRKTSDYDTNSFPIDFYTPES
ncbi:MAG: hypothetical protein JSW73_03175 [Candidatus Woesearchaeota archaeon]|nr:MAG: hypothetical protein JSW73_03175 [Candidatus Woesearchaeota archaeon]